MDYTEVSNSIRMMMKAQGIDEMYIDKEETLYYDESGNVKHLIVKDCKLNADSDTVFVLGGVQADDIISLEELKTALGKNLEKEIKSTKDLKGTFIEILRKENFRKILQIIQDKGWHIHFCIVQVLYYGFVDIIDSICGLEFNPFAFKAELYKVLKRNPNTTISIFKKYKYPNVGTKYIKDFLSELIILIDGVIAEDVKKYRLNPLLVFLKSCLEKAKEQKELIFIQNDLLVRPRSQIGKSDIQRNLILLVQMIPNPVGKLLHGAGNGHPLWFPLERGDGGSIADISVEKMTHPGQGRILKGVAGTGTALGIRTLQNRQLITAVRGEQSGNAGGPVGPIRFKFPGPQRLLHGKAPFQEGPDGVRLVPVGDNESPSHLTNGVIDNETGVSQLGRVVGLGTESIGLLDENPVPAVFAAAHDEIRRHRLFSVGCVSQHNPSSRVGIGGQQGRQVVGFIDVHWSFSLLISSDIIWVAWGSSFHSACSITRLCSVSGVSPG